MVDGVEVSVTTSKIVTDNDTKSEEMRFLRYVRIQSACHTVSLNMGHDLFNMPALNSSRSSHSSHSLFYKWQMGYFPWWMLHYVTVILHLAFLRHETRCSHCLHKRCLTLCCVVHDLKGRISRAGEWLMVSDLSSKTNSLLPSVTFQRFHPFKLWWHTGFGASCHLHMYLLPD